MADIKMGEQNTPIEESNNTIEEQNNQIKGQTTIVEEENVPQPSERIKGLSSEELKDPNQISVEIADTRAPIVVLFGPTSCGKTMTLVRLTRYLKKLKHQGYEVEPIAEFRPTYDKNYAEICENFNEIIDQDDAAKGTSKISFMLVRVRKGSRTICQILEAPGEYYFNKEVPNSAFPSYFNTIADSNNRKIWMLFVEPGWGERNDRTNYVTRISRLKTRMSGKDRVVIVYNKIDKTRFLKDRDGHVDNTKALEEINNLYPNLLDEFKNDTPIFRWFTPYKFAYCPFQTGNYSKTDNGSVKYQPGPEVFPRMLWKIILKKVKG